MGGRTKDGDLTPRGKIDQDRLIDNWDKKAKAVTIPNHVLRRTGALRETEPTPVKALVPVQVSFTDMIEVEGVVTAWTDRAVKVEFKHPSGRAETVWVWANAVKRIERS